MTAWQSLLLGIVQGLTEFLPISSKGHLALASMTLGLENDLTFDVLLHLATLATIIAFVGVFTGFYWWQFQEWPDFFHIRSQEPAALDNKIATTTPGPVFTPLPTSSPAAVLGASQEYVLPSTLYGLINGLRRDKNAGTLAVNPTLEATAQRLILQTDQDPQAPTELAKSFGFSGTEISTTQVRSEPSAWEAFTQLQADQRASLLLESKSFTDIGAALLCEESHDPACTTLILLGTR